MAMNARWQSGTTPVVWICMVLVAGLCWCSKAGAQDNLKVDSKVVPPGKMGDTIFIKLENLAPLSSIRVPLEMRSTIGGAFPISLSIDYGERLGPGVIDVTDLLNHYGDDDGAGCYSSIVLSSGPGFTPLGNTTNWGFMFYREDPFDALPVGVDLLGSIHMIVDLDTLVGQFEIDTVCILPLPGTSIRFLDNIPLERVVNFEMGKIIVDNPPILSALPNGVILMSEGDPPLIISLNSIDADSSQQTPVLSFSSDPPMTFGTLFDDGTGSGTLTLSPGFGDAGPYDIKCIASDGLLDDTVSIALNVASGVIPGSADSIIVQSKKVAAGKSDSVFIRLVNMTLPIERMAVPMEVLKGASGSFITDLGLRYRERLEPPGIIDGSRVTNIYAEPDPAVICNGSIGYSVATFVDEALHPVGAEPEGLFFLRDDGLSQPPLPVGADAIGSMVIRFTTNATPGTFKFDKTCVGLPPFTDTLSFTSGGDAYAPYFEPGVITINDPPIAFDTCIYLLFNTMTSAQLPAFNPADGDPISYSITGGNHAGLVENLNPSTGAFDYTAPGVKRVDSIFFQVDDGFNIATATFCVRVLTLEPDTVYVDSATGSDFNDGTVAQPFRTINRALTVPSFNLVVLVGPGTYPESIEYPPGPDVRVISETGPYSTFLTGDGTGTNSIVVMDQPQQACEIRGFTIAGNSINPDICSYCTGGITVGFGTHGKIIRCIVRDNSGASGFSGGIEYGGDTGIVSYNLIADNLGSLGAGVSVYGGAAVTFNGNTIVNNIEPDPGISGVLLVDSTSISTFHNNIIAFNTPGSGIGVDAPFSTFSVMYNNLYFDNGDNLPTPAGLTGEFQGWLSADPLFYDPSNGDYHLTCFSPARDAGLPLSPIVPVDLDGDPRVVLGAIDIGADEFATDLDKIAAFVPIDTAGCAPLSVHFVNLSQCIDENWEWSFGDGTILTGGGPVNKNPTHVYDTAGTFLVRLIASGNFDADTAFGVVRVGAPIAGDFTADTLHGCPPLSVDLTAFANTHVDSVLWDFGDGKTSIFAPVTHVYDTAGVYTVSVTLINVCDTVTITKNSLITVLPRPTIGIVSSFDSEPKPVCNPHTVQFGYTSDLPLNSFLWDFGDNSSSTEPNPMHTYADGDTFSVRLIAFGECGGDTAVRQNYIQLIPRPTASPTVSADFGCVGDTRFSFAANVTGSVSPPTWLLGDGNTASGFNVEHTYTVVGRFLPGLILEHPCGTDTLYVPDSVIIGSLPLAAFSINSDSLYEADTARFTDLTLNNPTVWEWNLGDGSFAEVKNPAHTYEAGVYDVDLNVSNSCGSDATDKQTIRIGGYRVTITDSLGSNGDTVNYNYDIDTLVIPYDHTVYLRGDLLPFPTRGNAQFLFESNPVSVPVSERIMRVVPSGDLVGADYTIALRVVDSLRGITQSAFFPWQHVATPLISFSPDSMDFGRILAGLSLDRMVTVRNSAEAGSGLQLTVQTPVITTGPFTVTGSGANLNPGDSLTWSVKFKPTSIGTFSGNLRIRSNDPAFPDTIISVKGRAVSELVPPVVTSTSPLPDGELIVTGTIEINFNENMVIASLDTVLTLNSKRLGSVINGQNVFTSRRIVFTPDDWLPTDDTINVTIRALIADLQGNRLDGDADGIDEGSPTDDYHLSFRTGPGVFPGDANQDGVVTESDVLPLARYWRLTGPLRPNASGDFVMQPAVSWTPREATHADGNGDGRVDSLDICPIADFFDQETSLAKRQVENWIVEAAQWPSDVINSLVAALEFCPGDAVGKAALRQLLLEIQSNSSIPDRFELAQNYPNPFNPSTVISYTLGRRSHVSLDVYDVIGRKINTLVSEEKLPGRYWVVWDGTDGKGRTVASGVYFYRVRAGSYQQARKMILLR